MRARAWLAGILVAGGYAVVLAVLALTTVPSVPKPSVKTYSAYAITWKEGDGVRVIRVDGPRHEVNHDLKGDRLTPEQLAIQWQGLELDGTPIEEGEFHRREEKASSRFAKR